MFARRSIDWIPQAFGAVAVALIGRALPQQEEQRGWTAVHKLFRLLIQQRLHCWPCQRSDIAKKNENRPTLLTVAWSLLSCTDQSPKMTNEPAGFLSGYCGQITEQLIVMADAYRIDSMVLSFEEALHPRKAERKLAEEKSWILAVETLEREVNNGGYLQLLEIQSTNRVPGSDYLTGPTPPW